jgi:predicted kinase
MMQVLIVMQGASGSGKSTIANALAQTIGEGFFPWAKLANAPAICSTDQFFYQVGFPDPFPEKYVFDRSLLSYYHAWNQWLVNHYLEEGRSVIVDNTNIFKDHAKPYFDMAKKFGIPIQIVKVSSNFENEHGVPKEVVENMKKNLQNLDELL